MNNNIVAEIINIVKTTKNNIDREDKLRKYFEAKGSWLPNMAKRAGM